MGLVQSIFTHADGADIFLMILGLIGAIGDGISLPVKIYTTSKLMNAIGDSSAGIASQFIHNINKVHVSISLICKETYTQMYMCFFV